MKTFAFKIDNLYAAMQVSEALKKLGVEKNNRPDRYAIKEYTGKNDKMLCASWITINNNEDEHVITGIDYFSGFYCPEEMSPIYLPIYEFLHLIYVTGDDYKMFKNEKIKNYGKQEMV